MTTITANKADCVNINRAPKGGAVSTVNGRFYAGGQFMPMVADVVEFKPAPLAGSSRQVAWADRLRRQALANLDDEIQARMSFVVGGNRAEAAKYRPIVRKLMVARHALMTERSAANVIDHRAMLA
jgi:hypothetical protein